MVTKGNVLVVDDEINLCRIIGAKLARSGYSVVTVHDGAQAVEKVRESDFDVVLLDLILPKKDGLSALAEIRSIRNALPVIVMTACENADAVEQAKNYGVSAYVNKPFDLDSLVTLVSTTSQACTGGRDRKLSGSTVLFAKNQPVILEMQNGCNSKTFGSQVIDKNERTLSILPPRDAGGLVVIPSKTLIKVGLATGDAYYSFTTHVLRSVESPEPALVLNKPGVIYRVQRREHQRTPMRVPVELSNYDDSGDGPTSSARGETVDICMGGACILAPKEVTPGQMLRVELLPKTHKDSISVVAHVLRSKPVDEPGQVGYMLGCRFVLADPSLHKLLSLGVRS